MDCFFSVRVVGADFNHCQNDLTILVAGLIQGEPYLRGALFKRRWANFRDARPSQVLRQSRFLIIIIIFFFRKNFSHLLGLLLLHKCNIIHFYTQYVQDT